MRPSQELPQCEGTRVANIRPLSSRVLRTVTRAASTPTNRWPRAPGISLNTRIWKLIMFLVALGYVATSWAHEKNHTHPALSAASLRLIDDGFYSNTDAVTIVQGSIDEDNFHLTESFEPFCLHFFNPITGLNTIPGRDFSGLVCPETLTPYEFDTAPEQAQQYWEQAIGEYAQDKTSALQKLGRVLHFVQDMTSPAHIHDDAHTGLSACVLHGSLDTDDFENWGWCHSGSNSISLYLNPGSGLPSLDWPAGLGQQTELLRGLVQDLFRSQPQTPSLTTAEGFVREVSYLTYNLTTYEGRLSPDPLGEGQQPSELAEMFPFPRLDSKDQALEVWWEIEGVGDFIDFLSGAPICGGGPEDEWWPMQNPDSSQQGTECTATGSGPNLVVTGNFYIENLDGGAVTSNVIPAAWLKKYPGWQPSYFLAAPNNTEQLRLYGDMLYPLAVSYGAGLLKSFRIEVDFFADVLDEDWHSSYMKLAYLKGLINGSTPELAKPNSLASRAEVLQVAYRAAAEAVDTPSGVSPFVDLSIDDWFYELARDAALKGFVEGIPCSLNPVTGEFEEDPLSSEHCFFGDRDVTRSESLKLFAVLLRAPGVPSSDVGPPLFLDVLGDGGEWFYRYVRWATETRVGERELPYDVAPLEAIGVGFEDGLFRPLQAITRGEMAKFAVNALLAEWDRVQQSTAGPGSVAPLVGSAPAGSGTTIGTLYEQTVSPLPGNTAPPPFELPGGNEQTVADSIPLGDGVLVDTDGDLLFYYWSADGGVFSTSEPNRYSSVVWTAPQVQAPTTFTVHVVRGDGRGKVGRGTLNLTVLPTVGDHPSSGSITAPNGSLSGLVTVAASVFDSEGLERVTVNLVEGSTDLVLCGPASSTSCAGTSANLSVVDVDPAALGATPGTVSLRLFVEDITGIITQVDTHTITWNPLPPGPGFTLSIVKEGNGDGTVSGGSVVCPPGCPSESVTLAQGTAITLTGSGDQFLGFTGDICFGADPCSFSLFRDTTVHASFALPESFGVLYTTPADGDTGVGGSTQPAAFFNRVVELGPAAGAIVFAEAGGPAVDFTPAVHNTALYRRLVLSPLTPLRADTAYQIVIPAGAVTDDQGLPLATPVGFSFTTVTAGMPEMYLSAYPHSVIEGRTTTVSIWFETPSEEMRTIELQSSPSGALSHPSSVTLPAGEVLVELLVDNPLDHGSIHDVTATLQATEAEAGTESVQIVIRNDTPQTGAYLKWGAATVINEDDGDGVLEAGEGGEVRFEVVNQGPASIFNVTLLFDVINTSNLSILGGSPHLCNLGSIGQGSSKACSKSVLADDELPTGDYFIKVIGTSSQNGILVNARIPVVNNFQPDYILNATPITSSPRQPGTEIELEYTARNRGDGFNLQLPLVEVILDLDGQEQLLYQTYADARGDFLSQQTLRLPLAVPTVPGTHSIRARINPAGNDHLPESDTNNNEAIELILNVAFPNRPPLLAPPGGPFFLDVGSPLEMTISATDPDTGALTFSLGTGAPSGMTLDPVAGILAWTPACGQGPQTYPVEIRVTDPGDLADSETVVFVVGLRGDLSLTKTASTALAVAGETVGFTILVTNQGPSCVSGATVTDLFEARLTEVSWTCSASSGSSCAPAGGGDIIDSSVALLGAGTAIYSITARISEAASGLVGNTASAEAPANAIDPISGNDSDATSITLRDLDYGDAADSSLDPGWAYPSRLADDGARHGVGTMLKLGELIDGEVDGQPTLAAGGDDFAGAGDEDGVTFLSDLVPCETVALEVRASAPGLLSAWIDFYDDGSWEEPIDQVFADETLVAGANSLTLIVPCDAVAGAAFARFRLSSGGGLGFAGLALDGEVEDYAPIIQPILRTLTVGTSGGGGGGVTILPAGIPCGAGCTESFAEGTELMLVASSAVGSYFSGWSEPACSGTSPCALTLDADLTVTANFELSPFPLTMTLSGSGSGNVTSQPGGIACPTDCSEEYPPGTQVTLTAVADIGSSFNNWSEPGCPGTDPCTVTLSSARSISAFFSLVEHDLTVTRSGSGSGTVTSDPPGIDCGAMCLAGFLHGTMVTLTASGDSNSEFIGWSGGGCAGSGLCELTVDSARVVNARFDLAPTPLIVSVTGAGTIGIDPPGVVCLPDCDVELPPDTEVTLTAVPEVGFVFSGWSGLACGTAPVCVFILDSPKEVTGSFSDSCIDILENGTGNWTVSAGPGDGGGTMPWSLITSDSHSPTHAWFTADEELIKDQTLVTTFPIATSPGADSRLRFWHRFDTEAGFDGGVLEVSVDGGDTWFDILSGDGSSIPPNPSRFTIGSYNSVLSDCCFSPLGLREAWSGSSGGWVEVGLDLSDFADHVFLMRWRFGTGLGVSATGWWIDDVAFSSGACPLPAIFQNGFESGDTSGWSTTLP